MSPGRPPNKEDWRRPEELPLDSQGEALPESVASQAQWIFRNKLYLHRGDRAPAPMAMVRGIE